MSDEPPDDDFYADVDDDLIRTYASNLPAIDWSNLDFERRIHDLWAAYLWPGWVGFVVRRVRCTRRLLARMARR